MFLMDEIMNKVKKIIVLLIIIMGLLGGAIIYLRPISKKQYVLNKIRKRVFSIMMVIVTLITTFFTSATPALASKLVLGELENYPIIDTLLIKLF
jgi:uncharacterized membrane protein